MANTDASAKAAAMIERTQRQMREMAENPELAKGTVGMVVFDLIRSGEEVSLAAMVEALEGIASGKKPRAELSAILAEGALKVISDLRP